MAKHLVTGGAGFIGSHICEALVASGDEVVCVDNFVNGKRENLSWWDWKRCTLIEKDVCFLTPEDFEGVDTVFHNAASKCTVCTVDPKKDLMVNAFGSFNVFDCAVKAGVRKVIHASTGSVHGDGRYNPKSFYGVSKMAGEKYLGAFKEYHGLRYTILRYFHVYGPRQDNSDKGGVIPIFIRHALNGTTPIVYGDGTQERLFTYVKDIVRANLVAAVADTDYKAYNCTSGVPVTLNDLLGKIGNITGKPLKPEYREWRKGDIKTFAVDSYGFKGLIGEPTRFDFGLSETIKAYGGLKC